MPFSEFVFHHLVRMNTIGEWFTVSWDSTLLAHAWCLRTETFTFLDGYCSTVQGLLDWFEVDLGFTELSFIPIDLCIRTEIFAATRQGSSECNSNAKQCNTMQHNATHCTMLHHTTILIWGALQVQHSATLCNTLQNAATHCTTLHHRRDTDHTAPHYNTHNTLPNCGYRVHLRSSASLVAARAHAVRDSYFVLDKGDRP